MDRIVGLVCGLLLTLGSWAVAVPAEAASRETGIWTPPTGGLVKPIPCQGDSRFLCGSVRVPIDRAHPSHGMLDIPFNVLPHRDPASTATDAVFSVAGGPGLSTIALRDDWASSRFGKERDIVLIDARGTGATAIRCPRLQHGRFRASQLLETVGACGEHLGPDADRYGTGDVALDIEAVRAALGYPAIDMVMSSYAGVLEQAYAVRYPQRVRSIVSDAPWPVTDPMNVFQVGIGQPDNYVRVAALDCQRAPSCADAHPDPGALFTGLAHRVARHPVVGDALDASNNLRHVVVDDTELAAVVVASEMNPGELVGVAQALRDGDPEPILRLGADNPPLLNYPDDGNPAFSSDGDNVAAICNDADAPWQRSWSNDHREHAYDRYFASLPEDVFAPWSVRGWEAFQTANLCIRWPAPDRFTPAVPRNAVFPNTPTLVLRGDFDIYVPMSAAQIVADEFPNSTLVSIAGTGHTPLNWSTGCAQQMAARFVETLRVGDTTCASDPAFVWPVIPSFPEHAQDAEEARKIPGGTDHSTASDRRVATAAMRMVSDSLIRTFWAGVSGTVPGLRGGTFRSDYHGPRRATLTFRGARFAEDVAIWGSISWINASGRLEGDLKIMGVSIGHVHLTGDFGGGYRAGHVDNHYGAMRIRGTIGRHEVALRIPAN